MLLALKHNLNYEISNISGLLHYIYSYKVGNMPSHAYNGADILSIIFSGCLQEIILQAIFNH